METIFGGSPLGVLFRLIIISIIVGIILSALGWSPLDLLDALRNLIDWLSNISADLIRELFRYFLLGATVVIPIWLLVRVVKMLQGTGKRGETR